MKFCNFRPFLIIAIAIIFSIVMAVFVFSDFATQFYIFIGLFSFSFVLLIIYFINKQKLLKFLAILFLFISIPFLSINYKTFAFNENSKYEGSQIVILGKICDYYKITKNGYLEIVLDEIEISSGDIINNLDGKVVVYTNPEYIDLTKVRVGSYVYANISLEFYSISSKDRWELAKLSEEIVAGGFTRYYNLIIYEESDSSLASLIKSKVFDTLKASNMNNADIAYGMIFGDTNIIDSDIKTIFQETGISHILAVSGLHVSAIVFAISFLLKKMKISQKAQMIFLVVLLTLYSYLCNFSASVIRSVLMAIILNYSYIRGKPYDRLSVLAMIASVMLLVDPLELFNLSFTLSFLSVLSIILLADPISRLFKKIFYDKFSNTLGTLFSIQLGLTFVNIFYFGTLQPLSFIANLVSIPLSTFAFILIICALIISMIFPFLSPLCSWIGEIFTIITQYNNYIKSLNATITLPSIPAFIIPIAFFALFMISDYCFVNKKVKVGLSCVVIVAYLVLFFI